MSDHGLAHPAAHPRFRGLLVALVAPVLGLTLIAAAALYRDWLAAHRAVTAQAQELAATIADATLALLSPDAASPAHPHQESSPPPLPRSSISPLNLPTLPALPTASFTVGPTNQRLFPPQELWPPQPAPLPTHLLPPPLRTLWLSAHHAFLNRDWPAALAAHDQLLHSLNAPDAPPFPRLQALALLERALTLDRSSHPPDLTLDALQRVLDFLATLPNPAPDLLTDAGVPIVQIAALRILDLHSNQAIPRLPTAWQRDPAWLVHLLARSPPTPFLADTLRRLDSALELSPPPSLPLPVTRQRLDDLISSVHLARAHHAAAVRQMGPQAPWPDAFRIEFQGQTLLVVRQTLPPSPSPISSASTPDTESSETTPDHPHHDDPPSLLSDPNTRPNLRRYLTLPESALIDALQSASRQLDRAGTFSVRVALAGADRFIHVDWTSASPFLPRPADWVSVARVTPAGVPVTIGVSPRDSAGYFTAQRQRVLLFSGILLATVVSAFSAIRTTWKSLRREHELNLQKSNFVSAVSHELRAPLGSIRLLAEGLERGTVSSPARQQEYYRLIGQECRRLGSLIENVLDFARIEQGRKHYDFEPTDILALTQGTLDIARPLADARDVRLEFSPPPDSSPAAWEVLADGRALQQALLNLLDNALKHSPPGFAIRVQLDATPPSSTRSGTLRLAVADSGPGIPPEDHPRIFEPFVRLGSELRRETQGIGIGLSIVRHVLDAHHGHVELESRPGHGARFTLVIPAPRHVTTPDH